MLDFVDLVDEIEQLRDTRAEMPSVRSDCVLDSKSLSHAEELCGLSLTVIDEPSGRFAHSIPQTLDPTAAPELQRELKRSTSTVIVDRHPDLMYYGIRIPGTSLCAGGVLLKREIAPAHLGHVVVRAGWQESHWETWSQQHSGIRSAHARKLLAATFQCLSMELMQNELLANNNSLVDQLGTSYETMALIAELPRQFHAGDPPQVLAENVLRRVQQIGETEWSACCIRQRSTECWQLHGAWGMTGDELESLLREFLAGRPPQVIVRNQNSCPQLRRRYPQLRSLAAVPLQVSNETPSWLILANPQNRPELGTEDVHLLKAVGHLLVGQMQYFDRLEG